ncbi:hypothetical protein D3C86_1681730 [compost metagenome]
MAHDGIDSVPQDGTWLLQKGERVTTAETSAKLDNTLNNISRKQQEERGGGSNVNIIEDASKAGQTRTNEDGSVDVWIANLYADGSVTNALNRKFGLRPVGS